MIKNPIIPGYYPDPTICRVKDDFYLVCMPARDRFNYPKLLFDFLYEPV